MGNIIYSEKSGLGIILLIQERIFFFFLYLTFFLRALIDISKGILNCSHAMH